MKLPVFELKINDSLADDSEVTYVALVDEPAIQKDFLAFNDQFVDPRAGETEDEFLSRCISVLVGEGNDQDQAAAICYSKWESKEKYQDEKKNTTSIDRMPTQHSAGSNVFDSQTKNKEKTNKSDRLKFSIVSEEKRIISGPLMIADELIYRNNDKFGEHYVKFSAETIKAIAIKFAKRKYQDNVNLMHDPAKKVAGVVMFESWIVDKERGIMPMQGFEDVADGSWFGSFYVENEEVWQRVKQGEFRGFSVEGLFDYQPPLSYEEEMLMKIKSLLYS